MALYAVIIAGGRGKRFWPQSRIKRPKYFLKLPGQKRTLLQQAVFRLRGLVQRKNIIVVTNKLQSAGVKKQLPQIDKRNIIAEPLSRNTAAAVGLAASIINKKDPDAIIIVLPADQLMKDESGFRKTLKTAVGLVRIKDALVTIGVKPTFPATGFGYIKAGKRFKGNIFKADKFIEKPDLKKAKTFIRTKNYSWNSGIFIWKVSTILKEIKRYMPKLAKGLKSIKNRTDLNKWYRKFPDLSIDYGVMEKSKKTYVVKAALKWHDIGLWKSLYEVISSDRKGNIVLGAHLGVDTKGSIIISEGKHLVGTVGLKDIIVIHTDKATLVCRKEDSELVKNLVDKIEGKKQLRKFL